MDIATKQADLEKRLQETLDLGKRAQQAAAEAQVQAIALRAQLQLLAELAGEEEANAVKSEGE